MKRRLFRVPLLFIMLALSFAAFSQVEFIEVVTAGDLEAAQKKADDGMLMMFVDVYASWCGPCKKMDAEVYADEAVAEYMNKHFVNVRMDGETDFGRKYAAEQQLQGYPSMYIFSDEGDPVSSLVGYKPAAELLPYLDKLVVNYKVLEGYRGEVENGTITVEDYADYISLVREMGNEEEAENLAGDYIRMKIGDELRDGDIRVVAFYMDLEDSWWPLFTTETERIKRVLGKEYVPALQTIYNSTLVKALEQENIVLISRMANELAPLLEMEMEESRDLKSMPFIQYYYHSEQFEELIKYIDTRFAADRKDDHGWLFGVASQVVDMDQQYQTPELMAKGEEWFSTCIELDKQYDYYFYHGMVLFFLQNVDGARISLERASELATNDEQRSMIIQVLNYINKQ
ncbi:MAG: thioredoxin [Bacteroidetes bacterium]|nr:thioredoxin [Bacteroidota bacterium]